MAIRLFVLLLALMFPGAVHARPKEDALAAYEKFFEYFATDIHDQLVTVFSPDVIFFGTIPPKVSTTPDDARKCFVKALTRSRGEVKANLFNTIAT
jgi:hypothetical protein